MGFNVTQIHLLAVMLKGHPLDASQHNRQRMDLPMYIFTGNHLHRRDADVQRSAGTSPEVSFLDAVLRWPNTAIT